jgi:hypothetical protein
MAARMQSKKGAHRSMFGIGVIAVVLMLFVTVTKDAES